jgi:hypothetical protein
MGRKNRIRLIGGILLIIFGGAMLGFRMVPELETWANQLNGWPMIVIGVGIAFFVLGLVTNAPGMSVPATIIGGIGGILLYQNNTGNWESWSYVWALIPGFVGCGILLSSLLEGRFRQEVASALWLLLISAVLFVAFGAFLGGIYAFTSYWPVALIILGAWILVRSLISRK